MRLSVSAVALVLTLLPAPTRAQSLDLEVRGGSLPGPLDFQLRRGNVGFLAVIILSVSAGPTPLALLHPLDPRVLDVGIESLPLAFSGPWSIQGEFAPPSLQIPNQPGLIDAALFCQGLMLPGNPYFVGPISGPTVVRFAPASSFRDRGTQFITARAFFPVLPIDSHKWMITGGGSGALLAQIAQNTTEIYDSRTDTFSMGPTMVYEHSLHTATLLPDGRWLIACGVDRMNDPKKNCEVYQPATSTFAAVASSQDPRMAHTATLLPNGKVLVTGGISDMNVYTSTLDPIYSTLKTTEIYDPVLDQWTRGPNLSIPRVGHAALLLPDGRVLLCGGISWINILIVKLPTVSKTTEIYDPVTNTISSGPGMGSERAVFSSIEIAPGKHLIAAGGVGAINLTTFKTTPTAVAEIYTADAGGGSWSSAGALAQARGLHSAFALGNGRFLHIGGADGDIFSPNALDSTEVYTMASNSWSAGPKLNLSRSGFGSFVTPNGQIHLLGGGSGLSSPTVNFTEWYFR